MACVNEQYTGQNHSTHGESVGDSEGESVGENDGLKVL